MEIHREQILRLTARNMPPKYVEDYLENWCVLLCCGQFHF